MAPVKCQLINPREGDCHLHPLTSPVLLPLLSPPPPPSVFASYPNHIRMPTFISALIPLFLVDEANLQPFHGFCESLFSSSSKLACDASILLGLLKKETMMLLYMLSIRFVTSLPEQRHA
nr:uncharacterized protein LOC112015760 [Quercus suber]